MGAVSRNKVPSQSKTAMRFSTGIKSFELESVTLRTKDSRESLAGAWSVHNESIAVGLGGFAFGVSLLDVLSQQPIRQTVEIVAVAINFVNTNTSFFQILVTRNIVKACRN